MARIRIKGRWIAIAAVIVIVVVIGGYIAHDKLAVSRTADAADSTAADDSTAAQAGSDEKTGDDKDEKETPPVPVEVAEAGRREISAYYLTTATLEPEKRVDILAKVADEIVEIAAEEGDFVRKGQLLCRLDDDELKVALDEAKINRDQKKADFERIKSMYEQKLISETEYLETKYQYELAVNAFEAASVRHDNTRIRAPFDGVVTERLVDEGENVAVGTVLFVESDTNPLRLSMYLPESELKSISRGQLVYIVPDANPDVQFTGEIVLLAPEVDERTGTVKVTAETRGGGIPGSFVRVRIVTDTRPSTLAIPRRGVVADAGDRYVFITEADTVRKVEVQVGYEDEDYAEILNGLQEGDSVVVAGAGGVRTGTHIKIVARPQKNADATLDTVQNDTK
jgi:membrane fusion protein (multidrug efflux system)